MDGKSFPSGFDYTILAFIGLGALFFAIAGKITAWGFWMYDLAAWDIGRAQISLGHSKK